MVAASTINEPITPGRARQAVAANAIRHTARHRMPGRGGHRVPRGGPGELDVQGEIGNGYPFGMKRFFGVPAGLRGGVEAGNVRAGQAQGEGSVDLDGDGGGGRVGAGEPDRGIVSVDVQEDVAAGGPVRGLHGGHDAAVGIQRGQSAFPGRARRGSVRERSGGARRRSSGRRSLRGGR